LGFVGLGRYGNREISNLWDSKLFHRYFYILLEHELDNCNAIELSH
jgi:hypothetical protein